MTDLLIYARPEKHRCIICTHMYKVRFNGDHKKTWEPKGSANFVLQNLGFPRFLRFFEFSFEPKPIINTMLVSFTFLASKPSPLQSFFTQLKLVKELSKLFGSGRLDKGRRALEVGRDGSLGGKSFGLTSSSLRRIDSNISSSELGAIIDGETDNIWLSFKLTLKFLWHYSNLKLKAWYRIDHNSGLCVSVTPVY